jgi:hypothetical protein
VRSQETRTRNIEPCDERGIKMLIVYYEWEEEQRKTDKCR